MASLSKLVAGLAAASLCSVAVQARDFIPRPVVAIGPFQPYKAILTNEPRDPSRICFVKPSCTPGRDDAAKITQAMHDCNDGGTIVLDAEYTVCSRMDLRFLKHVDVALTGTVRFCNDVTFWEAEGNMFRGLFQGTLSWWMWGGEDINLYGAGVGTIDGQGQAWWDAMAQRTVARPVLFVADGWHGGSMTGIRFRHSPNWHNLIANSSDILISDIDIFSRSTSKTEAKNLDGWDTYRSDNIVIQNSYLDHDDDCVSFKPNSTNVLVQGLQCNSSHGVSVGSLGQYPEIFDIVENLYIYNVTLSNATDGARIKVWPGSDTDFQPGLGGGGGAGYVRNVTYDTIRNINNDLTIQIEQCYGEKNATRCREFPSKMNITDVTFKHFTGTSSKRYSPRVGQFICSTPSSCDNIQAIDINIASGTGATPHWTCRNMDEELLQLSGVGCIPG